MNKRLIDFMIHNPQKQLCRGKKDGKWARDNARVNTCEKGNQYERTQ